MIQFRQARNGRPKISQQQDKQVTPVKDNVNYRRHRGACRFYRENWSCESEPNSTSGQLLYQIICLMDTPPVTAEEQDSCLHSPHHCWRLETAARRNGHDRHASPDTTLDERMEAEEASNAT